MSAAEIIVQAAREWLITTAQLRGPGRYHLLTEARQYAAYRMRHELGMSYPSIGAELGGRHHTTVMYLLGVVGRKTAPVTP